MDYSTLSDFEINCAVAKALAFEPIMFFDVDESVCHGPVWNVASGVTEEGIKVRRGCEFLPCTSWADAGPIIENNRIMLNPSCADDLWKAEHPVSDDGFMKTYAVGYDKNPLRAAMIVFLMMHESKKGEAK